MRISPRPARPVLRRPLLALGLPLLALALLAMGAFACRPGDDGAAGEADAPREVASYGIDQFMGNTNLRGLWYSPDGQRLLVSSDASGVFNAYAFPVAGGEPEQLTRSETDAIFVAGFLPDGQRFIYTSDSGGNELSHIYVRQADGTTRDLTPGEGHRADVYYWENDGKSFVYGTNARDQRYFDAYRMPVDTLEPKLIYQDETGLAFSGASPDGRWVALTEIISTSDSNVHLLDTSSGESKNLTEHEGFEQNNAVAFSPDGGTLLMTTDRGSEFSTLEAYDIASGERKVLVQAEWDVAGADYSESGKYLAVYVNVDARTEVRLYDAGTMAPVDLPKLPEAEITGIEISPKENAFAFYASTARSPRDLYVSEIGRGEPRRLSTTLNPAIEPADLVDPEIVRFASYDGVEVPGLLYKPHAAGPENKVPAVVYVHGGPGGQSRVGYSEGIQYLVNQGYGVYAINNRGSSGYGKTFYRMDDKKHGEADLDDVVHSKQMLAATGWVDPEKIAILGGSYGGYLTLAALTFRPEEFAAGVDLFGISNWQRTLESIPPYWESFRLALYEEMGDPATDTERLRRISPLFHADQIRRPLMVLQGANDPRVLKVESDDIVAAVEANGVPVEYVVFEDEGHGFANKDNREEAWQKIVAFLDQHVKGEGAAPAAGEEPAAAAPAEAAEAAE